MFTFFIIEWIPKIPDGPRMVYFSIPGTDFAPSRGGSGQANLQAFPLHSMIPKALSQAKIHPVHEGFLFLHNPGG